MTTISDRVDEGSKNRLHVTNKHTKAVNKDDPIKLLDAIRDVYYKTNLGIDNMDDEMLTTKKILNLERPGKLLAAVWAKNAEATLMPSFENTECSGMDITPIKKLLEEEGKTFKEYLQMCPEDMKKWDDQVREMQIAYQMRMGWKNLRLNNDLRRIFLTKEGKDDSLFPQTINDIIFTLDTAKQDELDHRKL